MIGAHVWHSAKQHKLLILFLYHWVRRYRDCFGENIFLWPMDVKSVLQLLTIIFIYEKHQIWHPSFGVHFTLSRIIDITVEISCLSFVRHVSWYLPLYFFIKFVFLPYVGWWKFFSIFHFLFNLSTWVIRYTHCWDIKFEFNSSFPLIFIDRDTWVNQGAYIAVFMSEHHSAEHLSKSVRGLYQSEIRSWLHPQFASTLAVIGAMCCAYLFLCLFVLVTCMCRFV